MAISFTKFIDITSGVGAGAAVRKRDLIGRLFSNNNLIPPNTIVEFDSLEEVGDYFGTSSVEYLRARFYFSWISKNITRAQKIAFARWVNANVAPRIYGSKGAQTVAQWTGITAGNFGLTIEGVANSMAGLDFSAAASLDDVAGVIQDAIQAKVGAQWTGATVVWNAVRKSFDFVGGVAEAATISVQEGTGGNDVAERLGWLDIDTIVADGALIETITDVLTNSTNLSNNFGSFLFMATLTQDQIEEAAAWNKAQNVLFQYMVPVTATNADDIYEAIGTLGGNDLTLVDPTNFPNEYDEMVPMIILAATDYQKRNSVQNYMFQQFALTPKVTTTALSNQYDAIRVNYYGRTQTAGQFIDFYQRGVMCGLPVDPVDQNVYANEQWLKDAAGAELMQLLLAKARVSANAQGVSEVLTTLQATIQQALFNGTISVGKPLNSTQKLYIGEVTGDDLAWHQVQNIGYWLDCIVTTTTTQDGRVEWKAVYTLIYSKDDAIRKVEGTHILI